MTVIQSQAILEMTFNPLQYANKTIYKLGCLNYYYYHF